MIYSEIRYRRSSKRGLRSAKEKLLQDRINMSSKTLTLLLSLILSAGCTTTSFEQLGRQLDTAINKSQQSERGYSNTGESYSLTVEANPSDATIKIMNIKPKYHDGIRLQAGSYDLLVQKEGYEPHREWVHISNRSITKMVELRASATNTASASSPTTTQEPIETRSIVEESKPVVSDKEASKELLAENKPQSRVKPDVEKEAKDNSEIKKLPKPQPVVTAKPKTQIDPKLRADYLPPELMAESIFEPAKMTENELPEFNGAYIKTVDEGFFSDSVQLIELLEKPAYTAKLFRMEPKSSVSITWLLRQQKRYFAPEKLDGTITLPVEKFNGIIVKGKDAEYVSLHRAERWVRDYDENGTEKGSTATLFDSNYNVPKGSAFYVPMDEEKPNKSKISEDSYFIDFKNTPEKGLYICWVGNSFWFFNLV